MADAAQAALWTAILIFGLLVCLELHKAGLATTHVRDLLHVGSGAWVFGWPFWQSQAVPIGITVVATVGLLIVPTFAGRFALLARLQESVSGGDERWSGLTLYAASFASMTYLATRSSEFPAAAALLALALGDGIGGAVGKLVGRRFFAAPGGKRKSVEGSAAVAIAAGLGGWIASAYFAAGASGVVLIGIGLVAAVAEALSPRGSDNVLVPAAVWLFTTLAHG